MKGQLNVNTPAEYIAAVDDKRRPDIAALDRLIRTHAPELEPVIQAGMLGYGPFHYRYASGREGDACKLGIASNKAAISLYCFASDANGYVAERYADRLGKADVGKSCVRFKKLADLDEQALVALIEETARTGLVA
jgi:ankyrin repeat protein